MDLFLKGGDIMFELIIFGLTVIIAGIAIVAMFGGILALIEQQINYFRR
jgi:hypothetical protein